MITTVLRSAQCLVRQRPRWVAGGIGAIATLVIASILLRGEHHAATIVIDSHEPPHRPMLVAAKETPPPEVDPMRRYPLPSVGGTPLAELYPSLVDWIHPVIGADRKLPLFPTGHFGAERSGALRVRCGEGHCGADLDGPRGRLIVAVAAGTVLQIDRSRDGKDGRSGRYVRVEHDDGALTSYMHLDSIVEALEVGDRVEAGQQLGTLGATGVRAAEPHLHISIEVPKVPGARGARTSLRYVDPAPFLLRATLRDQPTGATPTSRSL